MENARRLIVLLSIAMLPPAAIGAQRTFVASTGSDANPCSLASPCRSFGAALAQTASGGEIIVLDSAGYGPVTITQSVSITAPAGVYAGMTVASGAGIAVNGAGIEVTLRGLAINGQGGNTGVHFVDGAKLVVDRCAISGINNAGILSDTAGQLVVLDTVSVRNGAGVRVNAGDALLERVQMDANIGRGLDIGNATTIVHGGTASSNGFQGVGIHNSPTPTTVVTIDGLTISGNFDDGIEAFSANNTGSLTITISNSSITANSSTGISAVGATNGGPLRLHAIANTVASNGADGITVGNNAGSSAYVSARGNLVADNHGDGISVSNTSAVVVDGNIVVRNSGFGLLFNGGTMYTRSNNSLRGNGSGDTAAGSTAFGGV